MIPDNVEKIIMTKEDYDRNVEQLLYDKINAEQKVERLNNIINKAIEHIEKVKDIYSVNEVVNQVGIPILDISIEIWKKELLDILKGVDKE